MTELDVTLRDGRMLHIYDLGDPEGKVVVEHHGTPGSGLMYAPDTELARGRGLRIVRYDRAGYGGSTPNPGRSVVDVVADIEDVLDSLGVERYGSLGGLGRLPALARVRRALGAVSRCRHDRRADALSGRRPRLARRYGRGRSSAQRSPVRSNSSPSSRRTRPTCTRRRPSR